MTSIRWTPQAADDLQSLHDFIARDSPHYAKLVVERILTAVEVLEQFPSSGRKVPEFARDDLRELVRPPYRIAYRLAGGAVHILTIFRASRRIPGTLDSDQ